MGQSNHGHTGHPCPRRPIAMLDSQENIFGDIAPDTSVDGLTIEKKIGRGRHGQSLSRACR